MEEEYDLAAMKSRPNPYAEEPVFPFGVLVIVELDGKIVVEDRPSILERDPVLVEILFGLDRIPLESQLAHLPDPRFGDRWVATVVGFLRRSAQPSQTTRALTTAPR